MNQVKSIASKLKRDFQVKSMPMWVGELSIQLCYLHVCYASLTKIS